ncbi:MAG: ATP-dependent protease ATPase subunit HslU [Alphaproteobacteria bacterium]|nr:MAG: ATP-dependent protease ATPase subunit HslU [Alphaproteobacteria bacterium]
MTPKEIVKYLDQYIIGQDNAKKSVAIALRNRWRRLNLTPEYENLRDDIIPKNILMVGPTGVGKTEIARRLAKMIDAPFIKIEATKFTEIGYVGRDVEQIIRDLMEEALTITRRKMRQKYIVLAQRIALKQLAAILKKRKEYASQTDEELIRMIKNGEMDSETIEISESKDFVVGDLVSFQNFFKDLDTEKTSQTNMPLQKALEYYTEKEADRYVNESEVVAQAKQAVEKSGIVFIDEIDKICTSSNVTHKQSDVSREGVQRDLLPIVEGTSISTKYGAIRTDHILFIAAGAFHTAKPSDLIPELQGRFPIRVELNHLSKDDLLQIIKFPKNSVIAQAEALIASEGLKLKFTDEAINFIGEHAAAHNEITNIGARRLHTLMEKILDEVYFDPEELMKKNKVIEVTEAYVKEKLGSLPENQELARFML